MWNRLLWRLTKMGIVAWPEAKEPEKEPESGTVAIYPNQAQSLTTAILKQSQNELDPLPTDTFADRLGSLGMLASGISSGLGVGMATTLTANMSGLQQQSSPFETLFAQHMQNSLTAGQSFLGVDMAQSPWSEPTESRSIPGPILALRGWKKSSGSTSWNPAKKPSLNAVGVGTNWPAHKAPKATSFPSPDGGYWGLRFSEDIPKQADYAGVVAMWGKIIPHERGFRAEYAYPVVIWPNLPREVENPMPGFPSEEVDYKEIQVVADEYGVDWLKQAPWEENVL